MTDRPGGHTTRRSGGRTDGPSAFDLTLERVGFVSRLPKVFVVGCAKSGTTWVQHVLSGHPHVVMNGEGALGWRLMPELDQAISRFNAHQEQHRLGDHTAFSAPDFAALYRFAVCQRLNAYLDASGKDPSDVALIGDKTPQHSVVMTQLATFFPEARFVHVVRHPLDAATSAWFHFAKGSEAKAGKPMGAYMAEFIRGPWAVGVEAAESASASLGGLVHHVRYEDLHGSPEATVRSMLQFLQVETSESAIESCLEAGRFERHANGRSRGEEQPNAFFRKGVVGDWRNHVKPAQAERCCAPVRHLMSRHGYEVDARACA